MTKTLVIGVAVFNIAIAGFIFFWPNWFYQSVPGVSDTGPFNSHFLRDVALAYLVSGLALWAAAARDNRALGLFGAAWPALHAVFHIWIWMAMRGGAFDLVAAANLVGIQLTAWAALFSVMKLETKESLR